MSGLHPFRGHPHRQTAHINFIRSQQSHDPAVISIRLQISKIVDYVEIFFCVHLRTLGIK